MFHNAEMFQEVVGEGGSVFVFPRLIADIQKKGKPAFPNTHSGGLWVRDSSEEMHVCKSSAEIFLYCWLCAVQLLSVDATFASCMVIFFKMMIFFFFGGNLPQVSVAAGYWKELVREGLKLLKEYR